MFRLFYRNKEKELEDAEAKHQHEMKTCQQKIKHLIYEQHSQLSRMEVGQHGNDATWCYLSYNVKLYIYYYYISVRNYGVLYINIGIVHGISDAGVKGRQNY